MPFPSPSESSSPRKYSSSGKENCTADFCNADRNNAVKLITPCANHPLLVHFFPPMILRPLSKPFWVKHSKRAETTFFSFFFLEFIYSLDSFFFFLRVLSFLRFNFLNGDFVWRERKYIDNNLEEIEKRCIFI